MRRTVLLTLGILVLTAGVWLTSPPTVVASSGKIIYSFGGADGAYPESDLIMDAAGNLYGTTNGGGTCGGYGGCGTVFELARSKDGWKHQVIYSFAGGPVDGNIPRAGLVFDSVGNLYGATSGGGSGGYGRFSSLLPIRTEVGAKGFCIVSAGIAMACIRVRTWSSTAKGICMVQQMAVQEQDSAVARRGATASGAASFSG